MDTENQETAPRWVVESAEDSGVVLRRDHQTEQPVVRQVRELLVSHQDTINLLEDVGWTIEKFSFKSAGWVGEVGGERQLPFIVWIEASTEVDGNKIRYTICPEREEWFHSVDGLGVEFGVERCTPASHVMRPEMALRLLREDVESERAWASREAYRYLLAHCGPGEEPDPEEVERLAAECERRLMTPAELDVAANYDRDDEEGDRLYVVTQPAS